jgi:hypothetical protein
MEVAYIDILVLGADAYMEKDSRALNGEWFSYYSTNQ